MKWYILRKIKQENWHKKSTENMNTSLSAKKNEIYNNFPTMKTPGSKDFSKHLRNKQYPPTETLADKRKSGNL